MVVVGSRVAKEIRVCESHSGGRGGSIFNRATPNQFRSLTAQGEDSSPSRAPADRQDRQT